MRCFLRIVLLLLCIAGNARAETHAGYTWQPLGDGLYLHTRTDPLAGPIDGNSVVIVNDDNVMVVDTHIDPAAARAVIDRIRKITDKPVTKVVNTHWHDDHTNGNYVYRDAFPDVSIIADSATSASLREEGPAMLAQRHEADAGADLEKLHKTADDLQSNDPARAASYRVFAGYVEALRPELPALRLEYPDTVFGDRLHFDFGNRRVQLRWLGRGNTDGDIVVWLPDDRALVTGDLLVAPIPFAFDSPMLDWPETLARLAEFDARLIIPGHGPVQRDKRYLEQVQRLVEDTVTTVREAHAAGVEYPELADAIDLSTHEARFTQGDPLLTWAWNAFYFTPGLRSAWTSLGHAVP